MISIDEHPPSDPSSSHLLKSSDKTDLKSSDASADLDDTYNPLSNISIRDYVFGLRNKDIACNWPFSPTSLQLCLKHGVKNLLPPFESIGSLRNSTPSTTCSLGNRLTTDEVIIKIDGNPVNDQFRSVALSSSSSKKDKESQLHYQETLARTRLKEKPSQKIQDTCRDKKSGLVMKLKLKSAVERVEKSQSHHQEYLRHKKSKEKPLQKNENVSSRSKKSRFVMKLDSGVEGVEEVVPNSLSISEPMTSKVCPVCKTFSSSSNTTLNAHIDQCLTGEGTLKWTENTKVLVKPKVKPTKIRSMVDIYKTALHCTVEELDKRNGTSWATNSSFPAQESQFQGEERDEDDKEEEKDDNEEEEDEEKEEARTTKIIPDVVDNEGDVYIDTNGKKVRILSVPKTVLSDINSARKLVKKVKGGKMITAKKKSSIFKKKQQHKELKLSPAAANLCSSKLKASCQIAESCSENGDKEIIRQSWAWSERAGPKKISGENQNLENFSGKNRKAEVQCREANDLVVKRDRSSSGCDLRTRRSLSSRSRKKMRTPSQLIKPPLNEFRKKGTRMHLDEEDDDDDNNEDFDDNDDDDAGPSQHYDGGDISPKGSKFASLFKNISFPAAKFSSKRKFSAVENLNEDLDDGLSEDSSKDQSRMEEHAATRTNASKSSNEESSVGIRTVSTDEVCDLESVRDETLLSNADQVRVSSFMGLSTSFDPEFSKCIDLYQDQICSFNRAPNDVELHENYLQEADPIPIPGPPGSFLPASPCEEMEEMVSEEQLQATNVRSIQNQNLNDTMDEDSRSNSPVSTISNSRSTSVQDDTYRKPFFNGDTGFTDKGPSQNSLKNDQPCCCSRKEAALNYQESFNLRNQPIESSSNATRGLTFESEMFPLRNYPNSLAPALVSSPSKPVLRLMGKNLTVVKTDEDQDVSLSSQQFRTPQSSQQNPHRPVPFCHYQNGFDSQHFNAHPPINMRSHTDLAPRNGGFMSYTNPYDRGGSYMRPMMPQARSHHGHDAIDFQAASGRSVYSNVPSRPQPIKEIIVLDESPENEAGNSMGNEFLKRNQEQMNPLYSMYPSQRSTHLYGSDGSTVLQGVGFQTFENGDPGRWNIGSSSASPSTSHMRPSTTFYPPSYP